MSATMYENEVNNEYGIIKSSNCAASSMQENSVEDFVQDVASTSQEEEEVKVFD